MTEFRPPCTLSSHFQPAFAADRLLRTDLRDNDDDDEDREDEDHDDEEDDEEDGYSE